MTRKAYAGFGAPSICTKAWKSINWNQVKTQVKRLQMRIAKAIRERRYGKAKALQWLLTHSHHGKLLATKRVTDSRGSKTPGIDGVTWRTASQKEKAAQTLKRRGYRAQALRRVYIPKKSGSKYRPLGIPTMLDRAQQALHLLALEPVSEMLADKNAYGFRPMRRAADAIEQCFNALAQKASAQWCLEGDIEACFDQIDHDWLMTNVFMDKVMLRKWLKSGYIEEEVHFATEEGTPQGGIISPCLLVITLAGLERAVREAVAKSDKVNVVVYADDFIITGANKEVLEEKVKPVVVEFLKVRGLTLSERKTKITHISDGFNFLGFNLRKYKGKMLNKPSKESVKHHLAEIQRTISQNIHAKTANLICLLNPKIQGWANYYRHVVSKKIFSDNEHRIFNMLQRWIKRRHPTKSANWRYNRYYRQKGLRRWIFCAKSYDQNGKPKIIDLISPSSIAIRRHIKIRGEATPYDAAFNSYFDVRKSRIINNRGQGIISKLHSFQDADNSGWERHCWV